MKSQGFTSLRNQHFLLSLANLAWIATFVILSWQAFIRLTMGPDLIQGTGQEYLVGESLKLPWVSPDFFIPYVIALRVGVMAVFWSAAGLIFWRQRWNGFALSISYTFMVWPFSQVFSGEENPIANFFGLLSLFLIALFPFFFPDGHFIPRSFRWRAAILGVLLAAPVLAYTVAKVLYPEYATGDLGYFSFVAILLVFLITGLASQIYRYRNISTSIQRQQTKWVVFGVGILLSWIAWLILWIFGLLAWIGLDEPQIALIMLHLTTVGVGALPVTIGISILRYRLWDIDIIIRRTLVYTILTATLAFIYFSLVVFLEGMLRSLVGSSGQVATVISTLTIAALFTPLRRRVQDLIDRRFYRRKYNAEQTLTEFAAAARDETDLEALSAQVMDIVQNTMQPESLSLWIKETHK